MAQPLNTRSTFLSIFLLLLALAPLAPPALAIETQVIQDGSFSQFSQGELQSIALTSDGSLLASYARRTLGDSGNEIVWDAVAQGEGRVLCATGHHGKLVRLGDDRTSRTVHTFREPELTAMVRLGDRSVLVAAAPSGRIYRVAADDKVTTVAQLKASFVWRMALGQHGEVWAATGTEGRLFRLRLKPGGGADVEEMFKFRSANLLDLWIDEGGVMGKPGDVFVAGQNPGWLYRFHPAGKRSEVVYNASVEEIRAILPVKEGLALALNTERAPTSQALGLTLRMTGGGGRPNPGGPGGSLGGPGGSGGGPPDGRGAMPEPPGGALSDAFSSNPAGPYGMARSEVIVLDRAGFVNRLWSAPERPIHSLAASPAEGRLLVAAGNQGRLFEVWPTGEYAVVADVREDYLTRIIDTGKNFLLATARNGLVFQMERARTKEAVFISRPIDAGTPVKWGHFYWHGEAAGPQKVLLGFRSSNDGDPDSNFWMDWSKDAQTSESRPAALPSLPARYVQYRLTLRQNPGDAKPIRVDDAELYYIERNAPPRVQEITVSEAAGPAHPVGGGGEGGKPGGPPAAGPPPVGIGHGDSQPRSVGREIRSNPMTLNISWRASDPNNDQLRYALTYRGRDEKEWKPIEDKLTANSMPLSVAGVADGRYRFRIVASDELSNPPGEGLSAEKISDEVVIDNTPPRFERPVVKTEGARARITFGVSDELSLIAEVKVDIDNGDSYPLLPTDGIVDQQREAFDWLTPPLKAGEHVATFSATDSRGNTAIQKILFKTG